MKSNSFEGHKTTEFKAILYNTGLSSEKLKQLEMGSAGSEMKRESNFGAGAVVWKTMKFRRCLFEQHCATTMRIPNSKTLFASLVQEL